MAKKTTKATVSRGGRAVGARAKSTGGRSAAKGRRLAVGSSPVARPICFMVMPFGRKPTGMRVKGVPTEVDFDRLWNEAFRPVLDNLGYLPVRADQDEGPLVIKDMLERLTFADLVMADISIPNANVYYEIGIRHAIPTNPRCVIVAASWATPTFDLQSLRRIPYSLPRKTLEAKDYAPIRRELEKGIRENVDALSPMREAIPGYPKGDKSRATAFRDYVSHLHDFQEEARRVQLRLKADRAGLVRGIVENFTSASGDTVIETSPSATSELLVLVRDEVGFDAVLDLVGRLPKKTRELPFVREQHALALAKTKRNPEAIAALERLIAEMGDTPERRGLLGGSHKRLSRDPSLSASERGRHLDQAIEHYTRGMWLDLNEYYNACNLPNLLRTRRQPGDAEAAQTAATITKNAAERCLAAQAGDEWLRQTLFCAAFQAGSVEDARRFAREVEREGPAVWKLDASALEAREAIALLDDAGVRATLTKILDDLESSMRQRG